ncbi:retropepsin-like aspartic protease [Pedobacter sp. KR3-3]|uniref:Retropepsin-like aspartic protease n=1 Tax=Pedobacter albus TaxID=3113905 RepID=A0ABU7I425_9SPHI|nr:retropepsin-like aspartic protease [Pedobacter sp. KR3-3]MEE1944205.1 retropepsin-like aspartic protease [Pedobacter sp. KR3-3]
MKNRFFNKYFFAFIWLLLGSSVLAQTNPLPKAVIPFESRNGAIILTVKLNDSEQPLKLLFDTGADGMAIGEALAQKIGLKASRWNKAAVVGGAADIGIAEGNTVHLGTFDLPSQNIAIFKEMHNELDGIIGNIIARSYVVKVDFDRKELSLFDFEGYTYEKQGTILPLTEPKGMFSVTGVLTVANGAPCQGNFLFDTGASYNLICFRPFVRKNKLLVSGFKPEYQGNTNSMGVNSPTFSGRAVFAMANLPVLSQMPITLMAGGSEANIPYDGSIGNRLLSRYNFTLNSRQREVHLVPNKSSAYPFDFAFGGYIFGFDTDGNLTVLDLVAREDSKNQLKPGAKVKSINGLPVETLRNNGKQLEKLLVLPSGTAMLVETELDGKQFSQTLKK